jgi:hypothetical protein
LVDGYTYVAAAAPTITSIAPTSGSSNGGTEVTVYGSGFVAVSFEAYVKIGGDTVSYYNIAYAGDGTWLRFDTPAHSAETVNVTVHNPDGQEATLVDGYTYTSCATAPTVTTMAVSSVTPTSASNGGNVTSDGGASITARGVCWSESSNPNTGDNTLSAGDGTGSFTCNITGLNPGTPYHVRAYAVNSVNTSYGNDIPFITAAEAPIAITGSAKSATPTSVILDGAVKPNGADTDVVFEWGTDTTYGRTATADQSPVSDPGNEPVSARITGLIPGMHYHFRLAATNSEGTGHGEDRTFDTVETQAMPWLQLLLGD